VPTATHKFCAAHICCADNPGLSHGVARGGRPRRYSLPPLFLQATERVGIYQCMKEIRTNRNILTARAVVILRKCEKDKTIRTWKKQLLSPDGKLLLQSSPKRWLNCRRSELSYHAMQVFTVALVTICTVSRRRKSQCHHSALHTLQSSRLRAPRSNYD